MHTKSLGRWASNRRASAPLISGVCSCLVGGSGALYMILTAVKWFGSRAIGSRLLDEGLKNEDRFKMGVFQYTPLHLWSPQLPHVNLATLAICTFGSAFSV